MNKIAEVTQGAWTGLIGDVVKETKNLIYIRRPGGGMVPVARSIVIITELQPAQNAAPDPLDIDSGLGIGGISDDQSLPVIPSVAAIERMQHLHDTDVVCRRCGARQNFDGAMFTTGGGNVCDDCF